MQKNRLCLALEVKRSTLAGIEAEAVEAVLSE